MLYRLFRGETGDWKNSRMAGWQQVKKELEESGHLKIYEEFAMLIREENFLFPQSIHGMGHTKRVLIMVLCLCMRLGIVGEDRQLLVVCAVYHDVGRVNDGVDQKHGKDSFKKARKAIEKTGQDTEMIRYIIEKHCIDDKTGHHDVIKYDLPDREKARRMLDVFKDADGLDRLRIFDLNPDYLRHDEARGLIKAAYELLQEVPG
ncbi:MAG: HD domain-containing protein [Syntrophomonadaceae bacterium]|jgi:hypothetical protein|nr:HD domain-containing protein [Syntrophomonadaceae bacterium]